MDEASYMSCSLCGREVPLSEAVVPEASDYVAYFCGLECYARWRNDAARSLVPPIS
jgi:hypothetical protein